jgi:hypothetical protein
MTEHTAEQPQQCSCLTPGECQFGLVRQTGGKTFELCRTSAKHRAAFYQIDQTAKIQPAENQPTSKRARKSRGLGDVVAAATKAIGIRPCGGCRKRQAVLNHYIPTGYEPVEPMAFTAPVRRNLIYHIWPNNDEIWRWNVDQLVRRWDLFNGRKVIGIAVSRESDEAAVRAAFPGDAEFIVNANNPRLGEMVNFIHLLRSVETLSPNEVTFYAHAKGTKYDRIAKQHDGIRHWAKSMYDCLLDYPGLIEHHLTGKAMAGLFSMSANFRGFPARLQHNYSGTFYWFRSAQIYSRNWEYTHNSYYGSEMWPGMLFKSEDIHALMPLPKTKILQMYSARFWDRHLTPIVEAWKRTNERHRHDWDGSETVRQV